MEKFSDLHIHTHFSDSTLTPQDVVIQARDNGISCIAISDHDTVEGVVPTMEAGRLFGIEVLAAIELSSEIRGKDIHVLGYCFDVNNRHFLSQIISMQKTRVERMQEMIDKLKVFGIDTIELDEVCALAQTDSVGRPHLAVTLVKKGWVRDIKEAFDKYLGEEAPAYVPKFKQTPMEAIALIKSAGGVAVLAHPMLTGVDELIPTMVAAGLGGLEVYYPFIGRTVFEFYSGLAKKHGLLVTGGSDAHGEAKKNVYIGCVKVPYERVEELKKRAGQ